MPADQDLVSLTADIVSAHVSNNSVPLADVPAMIGGVYSALSKLGSPAQEPVPEKPKGAVSLRASIKPDYLVSMIDGKRYKMLRRHITQQGYTPESYRETFGLPTDYPLVAPNYAATRRELAIKIGLGRKAKALPAPPAKAPRKPRAPKA